jgi:hypothetical protein
MNQRERLLAMIVGGFGVLLVLWFGWSYVDGQFRTRRAKIANLERDIQQFENQARQGQRATKKLAEYEARSLPPNPEVARSLYQDWLLGEVSKAGLTEQELQTKTQQKEGELYVSQPYVVTGKGTLKQVIDLLHAFYSVDYLHRMRLVMLKPIEGTRQLDVTLNIDAVSVAGAPEATALHGRPSKRLAKSTKEDYYAAILGRSLLGPPNRAPTVTISGSKDVRVNRSSELTVRGSDPDPLDRVKYRLIDAADPDVRLDPTSGRFTITPKTLGRRKFVIEAYDDGYPSKSTRQELVLSVIEQPTEAPVDTTFRGFDKAKHTVLAGIVDVSGQSEVWLHNRPDGKMLKLRVGDEFEVGSIKGKIEAIGEKDFTFLSEGKHRRLEQGDILQQAAITSQNGQSE